jgi:hypothetical protein
MIRNDQLLLTAYRTHILNTNQVIDNYEIFKNCFIYGIGCANVYYFL